MSFKSTRASWEWLAQRDFLWAICTHPTKRNRRWDLEQFFATGEREIDSVFAYLEQRGIAPSDRTLALDFGCGVGRLTRALGARFDEVHGVDISPTMIARAWKLNAQHPRLKFFLNERPDLGNSPMRPTRSSTRASSSIISPIRNRSATSPNSSASPGQVGWSCSRPPPSIGRDCRRAWRAARCGPWCRP